MTPSQSPPPLPPSPVPRSLHLLARWEGGGTETNIHNLCRQVPEFEARALEEFMGFPWHWSRVPRAIAGLRALRPQVVFCYGALSLAVAAAAWPAQLPLVGSIRCETDFAGKKAILQAALDRRVATWVSNSRLALGRRRGVVIYNGIEEPPPEAPLLAHLPRPVYGVLARGHPKKRHDEALRIWQELGSPGSLVFAGTLPAGLRAAAQAQGVLCTGHVQAGPLLRSLDMLWLPSDAEGLPTVLLEAMVRGVPCLATPVGGVPELIRHGKNGWMAPRADWPMLLRALSDQDLARAGEAGRETVRRRFTMEQMVARFTQVARRAGGRR